MGNKKLNYSKIIAELLISSATISIIFIFFPFDYLVIIEKSLLNGIGNLDFSIIILIIGILLLLKDKIKQILLIITKSKKISVIDTISFSFLLVFIISALNPNFFRNLHILQIIIYSLYSVFIVFVIIRLYFFFHKEIAVIEPTLYKITMLDDKPLEDFETESFHRENFLTTIVTALISPSTSNSMVYAISGKWGFGKTTILNGVKKKIENLGFMTMDFSPWILYGSNSSITSEDIIRNFLQELVKVVCKENDLPNFKLLIKRIYKLLIPSLKKLPVSLDFLELQTEESINQLQDEISRSLEKNNKPLFIFIDDLDRMDGIDIINILKIIKMCFDIRGIRYILCYDREYIDCQVNKKFSNSSSQYIDKFVQMEFVIPEIDPFDFDKIFRDYLKIMTDAIGVDLASEVGFFNRYERIKGIIFNCLDTPRAIKLFLNRYIIAINLLKGEVDYFDLFLVQIILYKYSDIYSQILRNFSEFIDLGGIIPKEESYLNQFYTSILSKDENLKVIFQMLFPKVNYLLTKEPFSQSNNDFFGYISNSKGIHNPEYFLKYFIFGVQKGNIPDTIWKEFINSLQNRVNLSTKSNHFIQEFEIFAPRKIWIRKLTESITYQEINKKIEISIWTYLCNHDKEIFNGCESDPSLYDAVVNLFTTLFQKNLINCKRFISKCHNIYILHGIKLNLFPEKDQDAIQTINLKIQTELSKQIANSTFRVLSTKNQKINIFWILRAAIPKDSTLLEYSKLIVDNYSKIAIPLLISYLSTGQEDYKFLSNKLHEYYDPKLFLGLLKRDKIENKEVIEEISKISD